MAFIDWTPRFSVGSPVLDQQHKGLISIINKLHTVMLHGGRQVDIQPIFQDLITYTESHFKAEEAVMRQNNYPRLSSHQQLHTGFVQKAKELQAQLGAGKFTVSMDLLLFLKSWLSEHILGSDQQYAPFIKADKGQPAGRAVS